MTLNVFTGFVYRIREREHGGRSPATAPHQTRAPTIWKMKTLMNNWRATSSAGLSGVSSWACDAILRANTVTLTMEAPRKRRVRCHGRHVQITLSQHGRNSHAHSPTIGLWFVSTYEDEASPAKIQADSKSPTGRQSSPSDQMNNDLAWRTNAASARKRAGRPPARPRRNPGQRDSPISGSQLHQRQKARWRG